MLRLISTLRKRPAIGHLTRFISSEERLEQNFFWKTPLEPKIASLYEKYDSTLFFSTHIEGNKLKLKFSDRREIEAKSENDKRKKIQTRPLSIALSYLTGANSTTANEQNDRNTDSSEIDPNEIVEDVDDEIKERGIEQRNLIADRSIYIDKSKMNVFEEMKRTRENIRPAPNPYNYVKYPAAWMYDYETFNDSDENHEEKSQYGTPDPTIPVSRVPCYGCGGLLQCADPSLPGYLPSELMRGQHSSMLRNLTCQRCHFLINYNTALNLKVEPDEYLNLISSVKDKTGLVILMVDLLDFPCSIWPEMLELIGKNRPIFLVGNKVDLLPKDSQEYLKHVKRRLTDSVVESGISALNIKSTLLISAQTNYGVEDLITKLHTAWHYKGDVYLMGCTNVGKSTLFNALLRSDYCKVQASNIIKRATASIWPGTTLKMLKFPILRPSDKRLYERNIRLKNEQRIRVMEEKLRTDQFKKKKKNVQEPTMLIGHIGRTFLEEPEELKDIFVVENAPGVAQMKNFNENNPKYAESRWCYDTPGVIQPDQIINLLTTEELLRVISKKILIPRTYLIKRGMTLFLAGLGRVDYIEGPEKVRLSLFASPKLPILIVNTDEADKIYDDCLGTEILGVPLGDSERLAKFPRLEKPDESILVGSGDHGEWISCCDIVLSSAGWASVNLPRLQEAQFNVWTPECRGIHVRQPALLPYAGTLYRGSRIRDTPCYAQKIPTAFENYNIFK